MGSRFARNGWGAGPSPGADPPKVAGVSKRGADGGQRCSSCLLRARGEGALWAKRAKREKRATRERKATS